MAKKNSKILLTLLVIALSAGVICVLKTTLYSPFIEKKNVAPARLKGNPNAPIKIIEYMDFQCPACATGSLFLSEVIKKHPDKISMEVKYYPIGSIHRHAYTSAGYAQCAASQGKFWGFHDLLLQRQAQWKDLPNAQSFFDGIAKEAQVDLTKLQACPQDDKIDQVITAEKEQGNRRGVKSTPTYFVNGVMIVGPKALKDELVKLLGESIQTIK